MDSKTVYRRNADIIEITLKDCTGRRQDKWIANTVNETDVARIMKCCVDKCGMDIKIEVIESPNIWKADEEFSF